MLHIYVYFDRELSVLASLTSYDLKLQQPCPSLSRTLIIWEDSTTHPHYHQGALTYTRFFVVLRSLVAR